MFGDLSRKAVRDFLEGWLKKLDCTGKRSLLPSSSCYLECGHDGGSSSSHVRLWKVSVTQSFPTLCNPMDCSLPGSSVHGILRGKNTGVDCHVPLQGIFPTQISNLGLLHCRQILYCLSHQGSPGLCGNLKLYVEIIHQNERKEGYRKPGCQMNTKLPYQSWTTYPWTSLM